VQTEILDDADAVARAAADAIAHAARDALNARGAFHLAVSGGSTPGKMFAALTVFDVDWRRVHVWQVDERAAPAGHPDRNLTGLRAALAIPATFHPMPVEGDLSAGAAEYARELERQCGGVLDLVHLGLGPDGHTASLVPGDPVLAETSVDVAVTGTYKGWRRMTLTYPAIDRARALLWVVTGGDKRDAVQRLLHADPGIPGGRVVSTRARFFGDAAAVPGA
jgi:6-phosphogluconolactonase